MAAAPLLGNYVAPVPAQMRRGPYWFQGSADAIHQNLNLLRDERPEYVIVFGADHIYRMDPEQMVRQHIESGASVTVAALRVPIEQADQFGVIETAADGLTITAFREKPHDALGLADAPDQVYASMGNYVFSTDTRVDVVNQDADARESSHDMGGNIIPCWCSPERRTSMTSPLTTSRGRPIATGATGATSARWTRSMTPTWT